MTTVADAIRLAHYDRDGWPLNPLQQPAPTAEEALKILKEVRYTFVINLDDAVRMTKHDPKLSAFWEEFREAKRP